MRWLTFVVFTDLSNSILSEYMIIYRYGYSHYQAHRENPRLGEGRKLFYIGCCSTITSLLKGEWINRIEYLKTSVGGQKTFQQAGAHACRRPEFHPWYCMVSHKSLLSATGYGPHNKKKKNVLGVKIYDSMCIINTKHNGISMHKYIYLMSLNFASKQNIS